MPSPNDARNAALAAEGMTQGEIDYMNSGGTKTEGLTPPADEGAAAPPEPEKTSETKPAEPAAQPGAAPPPPVPDEDGPEPSPSDAIPYQRWHREKTRRQELQRELKARDDLITTERTATQAEREKWARLDERLRVFQQAVEQPAQAEQPKAKPDRESDPFAYMAWLEERLDAVASQNEQVTTQVQERDAAAELRTAYLQDAQQFAARTPDFGQAYNWLMANRDAELNAAGYTDPAERARIITADERDIVARSLMARSNNPTANTNGPAQIIYGLAKARGFDNRPNYGPVGTPVHLPLDGPVQNGAAPPSNGAAPATPTVTQQVETIQRGQAASRSLSSGGGSPAPQAIDLARMADMSDGEYLAWKQSLTPAQHKELASLLGAPGR